MADSSEDTSDSFRPDSSLAPAEHGPAETNVRGSRPPLDPYAVFDHARDVFMLANNDGIYVDANPAAEKLLGYSRHEILGMSIADLTPESQRSADNEAWRQFLKAGKMDGEFELVRKDGSTVDVEFRAVADVQPRLHLSIMRDISERRQRERQLKKARDEAEEMNRLKSAFLANMSHEIRTPLASIIAYADLLGETESESVRSSLHYIQSSSRRLLGTLNSVLDLAQLESGNIKLSPERFDLSEEARDLVQSMAVQVDSKQVELVFDSSTESLYVNADRSAITRVLTNLVHNAVKFTPTGHIHVGLTRNSDAIRITVEDTGIGIEESFADDLYTAFRQESSGLERLYEGSGLGLTITQHLVEMLGGEITVDSTKHEGTTFVVSLPGDLAEPIQSSNGGDTRQAVLSAKHRTSKPLLIVDDDPAVREMIAEMLNDRFTTDLAPGAATALRLRDERKYALILMDINPKEAIDGIEILHCLRTRDAYRETPVLAVTAHAVPGDEQTLREKGFDGYLSKPFTQRGLRKSVRELLD